MKSARRPGQDRQKDSNASAPSERPKRKAGGSSGDEEEMQSKVVGYILLVLMLMISIANAVNNSISVGSHEVGFNASIPGGIIKYWPMFKSGSLSPGEYYTYYETWLSRSYYDYPFLIVGVRAFENSIHEDFRASEFDTLTRFYGGMVQNFTSKTKGRRYDLPNVAFFAPNYEGQYVAS